MTCEKESLDLLRALAHVERQLVDAYLAIERLREGAASSRLVIRDTPRPESPPLGAYWGLAIIAALIERRDDGSEVERTCVARKTQDTEPWRVEREVNVNESTIGEPVVLGSCDLGTLQFSTTDDLARELPGLVDELLRSPAPR